MSFVLWLNGVLTRMIKILALWVKGCLLTLPVCYMISLVRTCESSLWYRCDVKYRKIRLVGVFLVGWRMNENLCYGFSLSTLSLNSLLGTRNFQSLTTGKMWIRLEREWKLKVALAAVSDPAVCVSLAWRQVPVYTCWPNQNTLVKE